MRARTSLSASLVALALLAGCSKEPKGQVVAIVDGDEISAQQISVELQDQLVPKDVDQKALRNGVLQAVIDRHLMAQMARKQGLDKKPDYLALKKRNEEELIAGLLGRKIAQTVPMPEEADIHNYIATHPLQFDQRQRVMFDELLFTAPKDPTKLKALAAVPSLDEGAATLRAMGIAGTTGKGAIDTGQAEPALAQQMASAPIGKTMLLPYGEQMALITVTARAPVRLPDNAARFAAASVLRETALSRENEAQIGQARSKAHITYSPGFEPDASTKAN